MDFIKNFNITSWDSIDTSIEMHKKTKIIKYVDNHSYNFELSLPFVYSIKESDLYRKLNEMGDIYSFGSAYLIPTEHCGLIHVHILEREGNGELLDDSLRFKLYSHCRFSDIDKIQKELLSLFSNNISDNNSGMNVSWATLGKEGVAYSDIYNLLNEKIFSEAYPYINNTNNINEYINNYLKSDEPILILFGKPGMGKTRLLRYIMQQISLKHKRNTRVLFSMDNNVFGDDNFYMKFLTNKYDALIIEDMDFNLRSRKDGNTIMHKLLAGSDGFIKNNNKKMIFTSNLPSKKEIDDALIREGRCYDVVQSRHLDYEEAISLAKKIDSNYGKKYSLKVKDQYTLAQIYKEVKKNKDE